HAEEQDREGGHDEESEDQGDDAGGRVVHASTERQDVAIDHAIDRRGHHCGSSFRSGTIRRGPDYPQSPPGIISRGADGPVRSIGSSGTAVLLSAADRIDTGTGGAAPSCAT